MSKPVDLVASQMAEVEQRREDAWAAMKQAHDDLNFANKLIAAGGWCAPSSATYGPGWQPGAYNGMLIVPEEIKFP